MAWFNKLDADPSMFAALYSAPSTKSSSEFENELVGQGFWILNQQKRPASRDIYQGTTLWNHDKRGVIRFAPRVFPIVSSHVRYPLIEKVDYAARRAFRISGIAKWQL